jgi:HEPN domain-containing protein
MYYLLTENFKEQHTELIRIILEAVDADKIYFLGSTLMQRRTESVFMTDAPSCKYVSHYYVLVLVANKQNLDTVQDKIENKCKHFIPVTAIVLYSDRFNQWFEDGHEFARTVCRIAVQLYGADEKILIPEITNEELNKAEKESVLNQGINKVTEFLAGADLYRIREQNKMVAFMLHQAAENALHTILKVRTGLYLNTHNLDKLIRYCSMVSYKIQDIFSRNNEKNDRLFQLLQKAYIDSRYKEDYSIRTDELITLTEKVRTLMDVVKNVKSA